MLSSRCSIISVGSLVFLIFWAATGQSIQMRPGQCLQDGTNNISPGTPGAGYAMPCAADWNGDGRKDLLVGYQTDGKIAFYANQGIDAMPMLSNFTRLKTGSGKDIQHISSGCGSPSPWVCDFDSDGKRDLLVGAGSDGSVYFYKNTNSDVAPILDGGRKLDIAGSPLRVGMRATPYFYDFDRDGLSDLLCGAGDGFVYFFKNTNTAQNPLLAPSVRLQAVGTNLFLGIRSVVRAFDWDGDGIEDLVCSSDTGVYWCRRGPDGSTLEVSPPQTIAAPDSASGKLVPIVTSAVPGARMRIDLVDWNNDGVIDMLLGTAAGTVCLYEGYRFRITSSIKRGADLELCWNSAPFLKYVISCDSTSGAGCPSFSNILSGGTVTRWTNNFSGDLHLLRLQIAE